MSDELIGREAAIAAVMQWAIEQPEPVDIHTLGIAIRALPASPATVPMRGREEIAEMVANWLHADLCVIETEPETCFDCKRQGDAIADAIIARGVAREEVVVAEGIVHSWGTEVRYHSIKDPRLNQSSLGERVEQAIAPFDGHRVSVIVRDEGVGNG